MDTPSLDASHPSREVLERLFVHAVSNPGLSRAVGMLADLPLPRHLRERIYGAYIRAYDVDMRQVRDPLDSFETFNAFFTRELVQGARPLVEDSRVVISPCDGRLSQFGRVPSHGMIDQVKGRRYRVGGLLGDEGEGGAWREGHYATIYLSPRDYHRVHCPIDGRLTGWRRIPGKLFPVNDMAIRHVTGLFNRNERVVMFLESDDLGSFALVMVGAANVGRMSLSFAPDDHLKPLPGIVTQHPSEPIPVRRGDELGIFNLGSTVVLLSQQTDLSVPGLIEGEHLRLGQELWRAAEPQAPPKKKASKKKAPSKTRKTKR